MKHHVYFISDGTGITAATLGNSLLTQFRQIEFERTTLPFIDTVEKAQDTLAEINRCCEDREQQVLIFATIVDPEIRRIISQSQGVLLDFFNTFIQPIENALGAKSSHDIGLTHSMQNSHTYNHRIDAVNYALSSDDGSGIQHYDSADIILVGVSRCGKTPTCLYMALQFGILAANYPITEEDMDNHGLPKCLLPHRKKLFGLSIDIEQLCEIRNKRRPNSRYASLAQCRLEVETVETLFDNEGLSFIDTSTRSIEEISATIIREMGLKRQDV